MFLRENELGKEKNNKIMSLNSINNVWGKDLFIRCNHKWGLRVRNSKGSNIRNSKFEIKETETGFQKCQGNEALKSEKSFKKAERKIKNSLLLSLRKLFNLFGKF